MATVAQPAPRILHGGSVVVVPKGLVEKLGPDRLRQMFAAWERHLEADRLTKIGATFSLDSDNHGTDVRFQFEERP